MAAGGIEDELVVTCPRCCCHRLPVTTSSSWYSCRQPPVKLMLSHNTPTIVSRLSTPAKRQLRHATDGEALCVVALPASGSFSSLMKNHWEQQLGTAAAMAWGANYSSPLKLNPWAWPPLEKHQCPTASVGAGMRPVFLTIPGAKRECTSMGVLVFSTIQSIICFFSHEYFSYFSLRSVAQMEEGYGALLQENIVKYQILQRECMDIQIMA